MNKPILLLKGNLFKPVQTILHLLMLLRRLIGGNHEEESNSDANKCADEDNVILHEDTNMDDTEDQDQQIQNIPTSSEAENPTAKPSNSKVTEDVLPSVEEMKLLKKTNPMQYIKLFRSIKDLMTESSCPSLTTASSDTSTDESNEALLQKIKDTVFGADLFELVKTNATAGNIMRKLIHKVDLGKCPP